MEEEVLLLLLLAACGGAAVAARACSSSGSIDCSDETFFSTSRISGLSNSACAQRAAACGAAGATADATRLPLAVALLLCGGRAGAFWFLALVMK